MTLKTRTISMIAAAAIALTAGISTAAGQQTDQAAGAGKRQGFRQGGHRGPGGPMFALRGLNLTDDQRAQVKAVLDEARPQGTDAPARKVAELQRSLRAAIFAETPDQTQIDQLRAALADAQASAIAKRIEISSKIAQLLTPEQRQKMRRGRTGV
jgi:Spy/CpxP family protein refolding chaperone